MTFASKFRARRGRGSTLNLHREEGDLANAGYWYERAGKPRPAPDLAQADEWLRIAAELLAAK